MTKIETRKRKYRPNTGDNAHRQDLQGGPAKVKPLYIVASL